MPDTSVTAAHKVQVSPSVLASGKDVWRASCSCGRAYWFSTPALAEEWARNHEENPHG